MPNPADRLAVIRARIVEANRRITYERPPPLSELRKWLVVLRHRHASIVFDGPANIGRGFSVFMPGPGELRVGRNVEFRRNCRIELDHSSRVVIGDDTQLTYDVLIQCTGEVTIGSGCLFANGASVVDSKHSFRDHKKRLREQDLEFKKLTIGNDVWVATKATVAADVGDHAVVAAHAVVTKPVPPWTLVAGVPARPIEYFGP